MSPRKPPGTTKASIDPVHSQPEEENPTPSSRRCGDPGRSSSDQSDRSTVVVWRWPSPVGEEIALFRVEQGELKKVNLDIGVEINFCSRCQNGQGKKLDQQLFYSLSSYCAIQLQENASLCVLFL